MKKLMRSKSGRQIYGPKWQNIEASQEIKGDENASTQSISQNNEIQTRQASKILFVISIMNNSVKIKIISRLFFIIKMIISGGDITRNGEYIYRAALEGD